MCNIVYFGYIVYIVEWELYMYVWYGEMLFEWFFILVCFEWFYRDSEIDYVKYFVLLFFLEIIV